VPLDIVDLRERPHHADAVAERIWNAFWKHHGTPLATLRDGIAAIARNVQGVPFALVAESDGQVCGNTLVIDNDEPAKPELGPWVAAVWVDEPMRKRGVARALIDEAVRRAGALGVPRLYLISRPALRSFYIGLGWRVLEEGVGKHRQTLYVREIGVVAPRP
jgi:GNAT superfamily N-acetyltransferase